MIKTVDQIYNFIGEIKQDCIKCGYNDIANRLDDAMNLGSSGLEILGAVRTILVEEHLRLLNIAKKDELKNIIEFVDKAYSR